MSNNTLTSKARVLSAVNHIETDRPPIQIYTTPEIEIVLREYFKPVDYLEALNVDFRYVGPVSIKEVRKASPDSGVDEYDIWGIGYKQVAYSTGGMYTEAVDLPFARMQNMDDVNNYPWPSTDDFDYSTIAEQIDRVSDYAICYGGPGVPDIINGVSRGRGMEQVLIDIVTDDEVGVAIIDRCVDFHYDCCCRALEAGKGGIDILWLGEDLGTQKGPTISPDTFDRFFRPRLQRFIDLAHDYGAKAMMHSCGSTRLLQSRLIEMGLDILDSVQPEPVGMDPEELKRDFGRQLTYCGMISTQVTLPYGSVEECRAEARHRIDVVGKGGGYIFSPAHAIQPDTPLVNILAIYEEATGKKLIR